MASLRSRLRDLTIGMVDEVVRRRVDARFEQHETWLAGRLDQILDEQNDAALADEAPTPEEAVLIDEEEHRLAVRGRVAREAVAQLAPKQREAMQLLLDGHTWAGAGKKLGVAPSAIGSRYKAAVKVLGIMLPDMLEHAQVA